MNMSIYSGNKKKNDKTVYILIILAKWMASMNWLYTLYTFVQKFVGI